MSDTESKPQLETPWGWYVGEGRDPEVYGAEEASREAAIAYGRDCYGKRGFTVMEATKGTMWEFVPDASQIIDLTLEAADDNGAAGDGDLEITSDKAAVAAAEVDLNELLRAWYGRHASIFPDTWTFASTRNEEYFEPSAPVADEAETEAG